jgi:hypothetical protein
MTINVNAIASVVRFAVACAAMYGAWRLLLVRTLNEEFRQTIFELRRELFQLAAANKISFSHPAYVRSRRMLNGLLRYAEHFSFTRLSFAIGAPNDDEAARKYELDFEGVDDETRQMLGNVTTRAFVAAVKRAIVVSPAAMAVIAVFLAAFSIRKVFKASAPAAKSAVVKMFSKDDVLSEAESLEREPSDAELLAA